MYCVLFGQAIGIFIKVNQLMDKIVLKIELTICFYTLITNLDIGF